MVFNEKPPLIILIELFIFYEVYILNLDSGNASLD